MLRLASMSTRGTALRLSQASKLQSRSLTNLKVGVLKEHHQDERRVGLTPLHVEQLIKKGATVSIEKGAGEGASFTDKMYADAGASIVSQDEAFKQDLVIKVTKPTSEELAKIENR